MVATMMAALPRMGIAAEWILDPESSRIGFQAFQMGAPFEGAFESYRGSIVFDPARLDESKVTVIVDISSVNSRNAERDAAIRSADWFDASTHPTATFVSESFTALGDNRFEAPGKLTMRGVTRPVVFPFTYSVVLQENGRRVARVEGAFPVARSEFGIGQGQWAGDGVIGDRVVIQIGLTAVPREAQ